MTEQDQCQKVYLAYPRHVAPRAALKAIQRAAERLVREKAQPDEHAARRYLWKRATEYSRSPAGQKPPKGSNDYRPHPATWFNADRFFDDASEWLKPNGVQANGRIQGANRTSKGDRTIDNLKSLLQPKPDASDGGPGGDSHPTGRRGVSSLFALDDGEIIEGRR